ncbi:hypothetical protein LguiB_015330 [Lonicera macranthoides]
MRVRNFPVLSHKWVPQEYFTIIINYEDQTIPLQEPYTSPMGPGSIEGKSILPIAG